MKVRFFGFFLLILFCAVVIADENIAPDKASVLPKEIRIAITAHYEKANGESGKKVTYGGSALINRIITEGWLEAELKKRDIQLTWVPIQGDVGPLINEGFAGGRIYFASYGDLPSLILNSAGVRTRVIVPNGSGTDTFLLVPKNSTAQTIHDLKGKRISIHRGRPWELSFLRLLESNGLTYRDFKILNISTASGASALAAGKIDAHYANSGYTLEDKGVGKIIWSTKGQSLGKMRAELWGTEKFSNTHPELTQLVANAWVKALYWASQENNREQVIQLATRNGTPASVIRRQYDDPSLHWKDRWSPLFDEVVAVHYQQAAQFAHDKKLIRKPVESSQLLDQRFVKVALKELQLENYWLPCSVAETAAPAKPEKTKIHPEKSEKLREEKITAVVDRQ